MIFFDHYMLYLVKSVRNFTGIMIKIGNLSIKYRAILSPMASLTDISFRQLLDEIGHSGIMVTELISAEAVRRRSSRTLEMIKSFDFKTPQFIQLFGSDPVAFSEAVMLIENETNFSGIDLNMGCPANKVIKKGAGAKLLTDHKRLAEIVAAVKKRTSLPVTAKIRLGFDQVNVFETIKILEGEGIDAITVHFRLKSERYSMPAHWEYAKSIKAIIKTVFIGNGDILTRQDALTRLKSVDMVMIGRGAIANPLIFREISGQEIKPGDPQNVARRLIQLITENYQPDFRLIRLKAYTRFMAWNRTRVKKTRQLIYTSDNFSEASQLFLGLFAR